MVVSLCLSRPQVTWRWGGGCTLLFPAKTQQLEHSNPGRHQLAQHMVNLYIVSQPHKNLSIPSWSAPECRTYVSRPLNLWPEKGQGKAGGRRDMTESEISPQNLLLGSPRPLSHRLWGHPAPLHLPSLSFWPPSCSSNSPGAAQLQEREAPSVICQQILRVGRE